MAKTISGFVNNLKVNFNSLDFSIFSSGSGKFLSLPLLIYCSHFFSNLFIQFYNNFRGVPEGSESLNRVHIRFPYCRHCVQHL